MKIEPASSPIHGALSLAPARKGDCYRQPALNRLMNTRVRRKPMAKVMRMRAATFAKKRSLSLVRTHRRFETI